MNKPIDTLHDNATGFFNKVQEKYKSDMLCSAGCSKCCYTDISVFEVESEKITAWFESLALDFKDQLKNLWSQKNDNNACAFLYDNKCTIYEVRPLICRTQGAPLYLSTENILDYCPLNFTHHEPEKSYWLNLERLNTMLSLAATAAGKQERIRLTKLKRAFLSK